MTQWSNSNSSLQVRSNVFWERRTRMFSSEISSNTVPFEDFESWYRNHYKRHHTKKEDKDWKHNFAAIQIVVKFVFGGFSIKVLRIPTLRILLRFGQNLLDHEWLRKTNAPALEDLAVKHSMFCYLDWITKCCKSWRRIQTLVGKPEYQLSCFAILNLLWWLEFFDQH